MAQADLEQIALAMMMMAGEKATRGQSFVSNSTPAGEKNVIVSTTSDHETISANQRNSEDPIENKDKGYTEEGVINYSTNSNSTPYSPVGNINSEEGSNSSSNGGATTNGGVSANSSTRRIFTAEFKQAVIDAFLHDSECIGNQRATARKFGIHRRQVQKWLLQQPGGDSIASGSNTNNKDLLADDYLSEKESQPEETTTPTKSTKFLSPSSSTIKSNSTMPIITQGKYPSFPTAATIPPPKLNNSLPLFTKNHLQQNNNNGPITNYHNGSSPSSAAATAAHNLLMGLNLNLNNSNFSIPPISLENNTNNNHHHSRQQHSPLRSSPQSGGSTSSSSGFQGSLMTLDLVDELCYLYPSQDFSLLRKALIKNEVSLTKLSPPKSSYNHYNNSSSRSPTPSKSNDYVTNQTLQLIKQQNEYVQLLQQSGLNMPVFPNDIANTLSQLTENNSKYHPPSWFGLFAAAVGLPMPGLNNNNNKNNNNKKSTSATSEGHHTFLSPAAPISSSNHKVKTVAAALAATRKSPNYSQGAPTKASRRSQSNGNGRRARQSKSSTITRPSEDDYMDPTAFLELTTSTGASSSTNFHMNGDENQGMDLSTGLLPSRNNNNGNKNSMCNSSSFSSPPTTTANPQETFLSQFGLRKQPNNENSISFPTPTSSLENFIQSVLPMNNNSKSSSSSSPNSSSSLNENDSTSDSTKDMVIKAFTYDPEVGGDARGVARKFGLNIRVVMKWLREGPSKVSSPFDQLNKLNGGHHHYMNGGVTTDDDENNEDGNNVMYRTKIIQQQLPSSTTTTTSVNKRKNSKPNQICDFTQNLIISPNGGVNGPIDMVVPIKKRRLSAAGSSS